MTAYISVPLEASTVIEAMTDDGNFIEEFISELAAALRAGRLLDDLHDMANLNQAWNEDIQFLAEELKRLHEANAAR